MKQLIVAASLLALMPHASGRGDASTLELLHHLLDKVPGIRALVLAVSRPEFDPPWVSYRNLHSISLNRLDANQIENMALAITQNKFFFAFL